MNNPAKILFLSIFSVVVATRATRAAGSPRTIINLNPGWRFFLDKNNEEPQAEQPKFDDSKWDAISLPHTWNNLDGQDGGNNYFRGTGWYRLHLKADPAWVGKQIYLKFDAASINATVYVNGKEAGQHAGAFAAFCFDIKPLLNLNGENVIAVKVSNKHDNNVAPLSGDFDMNGGLYRGASLLVLNQLSVSATDDASSGVYVRQDKVDADNASLNVTTKVDNRGDAIITPSVKTEILDPSESVVATETRRGLATLGQGGSESIRQEIALPHPHLWNGRKDPFLYTVRVSLLDGQTVTDIVEQPVGLRFYHVDPEKGFFLNGQPYRLYGVNRHQDHLDEGWAISLADHQLDFANMMEMGCTAVRLSHYQHAQEFYDLCDRGGMVAWAELPLVNEVRDDKAFDDNASQQLRELIKQSYNHPSICFWSLSNELRGSGKNGPDPEKHEVDLLTRLNNEAHALDPTRLTTQASAVQPGKPRDNVTDIVAFNRYHGWYGGKPDGLAADLDKIHAAYPNRSVGLSEFGAGASIFQHEASVKQPKPNGSKWHPEEWQCIVHEEAWAAIKPRPWIWGTFIWAEHDFAADQRNEGDHAGRNDKGMTTYDGKTKKDVFYFYKANWSAEPVVYITERRFTPRPVADAPVKIYSNCDSVELKVNGESQGIELGSDIHTFLWNKVQMKPGENTLTATGQREGKTYTDTCAIVFDVNATDGHAPATQPVK
jgi:beta-galactosidase